MYEVDYEVRYEADFAPRLYGVPKLVESLDIYDGAALSWIGETYLGLVWFHASDRDDETGETRWLTARVTPEDVEALKSGTVTLREVLGETVRVVDLDPDLRLLRAWMVKWDRLSERHRPADDARFGQEWE